MRKSDESPFNATSQHPSGTGLRAVCIAAGFALAAQAQAQTTPGGAPPGRPAATPTPSRTSPAAADGRITREQVPGALQDPSSYAQPASQRLAPNTVPRDVRFEPYAGVRVTYTDNAVFDRRVQGPEDTLTELRAGINVDYEGARARLNGNVEANGIQYARGTREDRVLPRADLRGTLEAIERFAYLDASVLVYQTSEDPFGAQPVGIANTDQSTTKEYRVSPYLQGRLGENARYLLRNDYGLTRTEGDQAADADGTYRNFTGRLERDPLPFGGAVEVERSESEFDRQDASTLERTLARVIGSYAFTPDLTGSVRGGYARDEFVFQTEEGPLYGVGVDWRPTARTQLDGYWEHRQFGGTWAATLSHRLPRAALSVATSRQLTTFLERLFLAQPTGDLRGLLDAAFATRIPDPVAREAVVREVIARQGLPNALTSPTDIQSNGVQMVQSNNGSIVFLGQRTAIGFTIFRVRTESVQGGGNPAIVAAAENNVQTGASANLSHRLGERMAVNLVVARSRTTGLGAFESSESKQTSVQAQVSRDLTPRTAGVIGARYQTYRTSGLEEIDETAVFAGVQHRF